METESEKARTKVPRALWSDQNIADLKKINIIVSVIIFRHLIGPHDGEVVEDGRGSDDIHRIIQIDMHELDNREPFFPNAVSVLCMINCHGWCFIWH